MKIWDATTGAEVNIFLDCDECGAIFFWGEGGAICAWYWKRFEVTVRWQVFTLRGHTGRVYSVAIFPDGKRIVSGSQDELVKIWDVATGVEVISHGKCTV